MLFSPSFIRLPILIFFLLQTNFSTQAAWILQPFADSDAIINKKALSNHVFFNNSCVFKTKWISLFQELHASSSDQSRIAALFFKYNAYIEELDTAPKIVRDCAIARLLLVIADCVVSKFFDHIHMLIRLRNYWRYYEQHPWIHNCIFLPKIVASGSHHAWSTRKKIQYLDELLLRCYRMVGGCMEHVVLLSNSIHADELSEWNKQLIGLLSCDTADAVAFDCDTPTDFCVYSDNIFSENNLFFKKNLILLNRYHVIEPHHLNRQWIAYIIATGVGYVVYKNMQVPDSCLQRIINSIQDFGAHYIIKPLDAVWCALGCDVSDPCNVTAHHQNNIIITIDGAIDGVISYYNSDAGKQELAHDVQSVLDTAHRQYTRCVHPTAMAQQQTVLGRTQSVLWNVAISNPVSKAIKHGSGTAVSEIVLNGSDKIIDSLVQAGAEPIAQGATELINLIFDRIIKKAVMTTIKEKHRNYVDRYRVQRAFFGLLPAVVGALALCKAGNMISAWYQWVTSLNHQEIKEVLISVQECCVAMNMHPTHEQYGRLLYHVIQLRRCVEKNVPTTHKQYELYLRLLGLLQDPYGLLQEKSMLIEILKTL